MQLDDYNVNHKAVSSIGDPVDIDDNVAATPAGNSHECIVQCAPSIIGIPISGTVRTQLEDNFTPSNAFDDWNIRSLLEGTWNAVTWPVIYILGDRAPIEVV